MRIYEAKDRMQATDDSDSPYSARPYSCPESPYKITWPRYEKSNIMREDVATLAEMLRPISIPENASLAYHVFGNQKRQQKLSLKHIANLIGERAKLNKRILDDIGHRDMQIQEQIFGARLHSKVDNHAREMKLQQVLFQLDEQRRKEELDFWKDTADLRDQMSEAAREYQVLGHRTSLLEGIEPEDKVHG